MEKKKKRGPQPKPPSELKVPVKIWVKKKYLKAATADLRAIEARYNAAELP